MILFVDIHFDLNSGLFGTMLDWDKVEDLLVFTGKICVKAFQTSFNKLYSLHQLVHAMKRNIRHNYTSIKV